MFGPSIDICEEIRAYYSRMRLCTIAVSPHLHKFNVNFLEQYAKLRSKCHTLMQLILFLHALVK